MTEAIHIQKRDMRSIRLHLLPDGHVGLDGVDGEVSRLERLPPVRGRHGDRHARLPHGADPQAVLHGHLRHAPPLPDLFADGNVVCGLEPGAYIMYGASSFP